MCQVGGCVTRRILPGGPSRISVRKIVAIRRREKVSRTARPACPILGPMPDSPIVIPESLVTAQSRYGGEAGRAWLAALPEAARSYLDRWELTLDGPSRSGMGALVLPVRRPDGGPAVLKLQRRDGESDGEAIGLRIWNGAGAVRLLDDDPDTATLLLERLDGERSLATVPDDTA